MVNKDVYIRPMFAIASLKLHVSAIIYTRTIHK